MNTAKKMRETPATADEEPGRRGAGDETGGVEEDNPPGAISDQNREEGPSELREDGTHPEPRTRTPKESR